MERTNKIAVVTGATGGIGKAITYKLLSEDYTVIAFFNKDVKSAEMLRRMGADTVQCDFSVLENVTAAAEEVLKRYTAVDVLVINHGISQTGLFTDFGIAEITRLMNVNLLSAMLFTKAFIPSMVSEKYGKIINIGSVWGVCGASTEAQYSASKAGLHGFTKALAKELGPSNINVNCIAPGYIETDMNSHLTSEEKAAFLNETALLRAGTPEDVAALVSFLAGDASSYITGQIINIDGGTI